MQNSSSPRAWIRRTRAAIVFLVLATISVGGAFAVSGTDWMMPQSLAVLGLIVVLNVLLSVASGEVNDRLWASASVMLVFVAGFFVVLLLGTSVESFRLAIAAQTVVAASGFYTRGDWRERRWARSAMNLGQLAMAGFVSGLATLGVAQAIAMPSSSGSPGLSDASGWYPTLFVLGLVGPFSYAMTNLVGVKLGVRMLYGRGNVLPWSHLRSIVFSLIAMGVIGAFVGVLFATTPEPAVIPLTLVVFVVGQQVFISMARLRTAHENTINGFVKTLEARDLYTRGHTEKVAEFCRLAGEELGLSDNRLERLRWAALIHDVGKLAVPAELMQSPQQFGDPQRREYHAATHRVDDLLCEVDFLRPMVVISSGFHPAQRGVDYGQTGHIHDQPEPTEEQQILAVADAFDAMTSSRSYRMAISQSAALEQLRRSGDALYTVDVVDALERGLTRVGREYGPPDIDRNHSVSHNG